MEFYVLPVRGAVPPRVHDAAFLIRDNWDDYSYKTQFYLVFVDPSGIEHPIGQVKIAQFDMEERRRPLVPAKFESLPRTFFSLGQGANYYTALNALGATHRDIILTALRDVAKDATLFEKVLTQDVTGVSLLRFVTPQSVRGQLRRLAAGGALLTHYSFEYTLPLSPGSHSDPINLSFNVDPESQPPTNIHVLIGRNGVGKTWMLQRMAQALMAPNDPNNGTFIPLNREDHVELFANLVSVSFSAFDSFVPLPEPRNKSANIQYSYIGLKRKTTDTPKTPDQLLAEFVQSVSICRQPARVDRWTKALRVLESDPIFAAASVADLARVNVDVPGIITTEEAHEALFKKNAQTLFRRLSSGHKLVLLTITKLVETVAERTLVLMDEPEAHLHPPLLSAFTRSLSDLLLDLNGVAIVATHSPVVLQEVPMKCVWIIRRTGYSTTVERPEAETFGENVGVLTRDVFGLEVTHSGFHQLLEDALQEARTYDELLQAFGGQLGGEARALAYALLAERVHDDDGR